MSMKGQILSDPEAIRKALARKRLRLLLGLAVVGVLLVSLPGCNLTAGQSTPDTNATAQALVQLWAGQTAAAIQPTAAVAVTQASPPPSPTKAPTAPTAPPPTPLPPTVEPSLAPASPAPSAVPPTPEPKYKPRRTSLRGPGIPPEAPPAPAPTPVPEPCFGNQPPTSTGDFYLPDYMVISGEPCVLMGAYLSVNGTKVDSWGAQSALGAWYYTQSGSCTVDYQTEYDWILSATYATECAGSLADFDTPTSWPDSLVVGQKFYLDGRLVDSWGTTGNLTDEESGTCEGVDWRYLVHRLKSTPTVPEASTWLLLGSGLTTLAGWMAWQRRRRSRA
jgi:hypothetical protein